MLGIAMYGRLRSAPVILPLTVAAFDVFGVSNASADIRGYVDAIVDLYVTVVHYPLLVVNGLSFALIIGMNIRCPHRATLSFVDVLLRLCARVCEVCR